MKRTVPGLLYTFRLLGLAVMLPGSRTVLASTGPAADAGGLLLGLVILGIGSLLGIRLWLYKRCPVCNTRGVFATTGIQDQSGRNVEYKCDNCGYAHWKQSPRRLRCGGYKANRLGHGEG